MQSVTRAEGHTLQSTGPSQQAPGADRYLAGLRDLHLGLRRGPDHHDQLVRAVEGPAQVLTAHVAQRERSPAKEPSAGLGLENYWDLDWFIQDHTAGEETQ